MQTGVVYLGDTVVNIELPDAKTELLPGISWGAVESFPTPAHWTYQVLARRIQGSPIRYKLGSTLKEEVGACLLGGHGIPAHIGLAAYELLKSKEIFSKQSPSTELLYKLLSEPMKINGKLVKYRFAKQKAKYLSTAMQKLSTEKAPDSEGRALRDWLITIPGIGFKTASWVARNWLQANDIAILDIHILRAGILGGFFNSKYSVERDYLKLEQQFLEFSSAVGIPASELDAEIWWQMSNSPKTVHDMLTYKGREIAKKTVKSGLKGPKNRHSNTNQTTLFI